MNADDPSPKTFASQLRAADRFERGAVISSYSGWLRQGARAQGFWACGSVLVGGSLFAVFEGWLSGVHSPFYWAACAVAFLAGALITEAGWKRERQWRQANPWKGPRNGG